MGGIFLNIPVLVLGAKRPWARLTKTVKFVNQIARKVIHIIKTNHYWGT